MQDNKEEEEEEKWESSCHMDGGDDHRNGEESTRSRRSNGADNANNGESSGMKPPPPAAAAATSRSVPLVELLRLRDVQPASSGLDEGKQQQQQQQQQQRQTAPSSSSLISNGHSSKGTKSHLEQRFLKRPLPSTTTRMGAVDTTTTPSAAHEPHQQQQAQSQFTPPLSSRLAEYAFLFLLHVVCLSVYIIPVLLTRLPVEYTSANTRSGSLSSPVLDELHIMSSENLDIHGHSKKSLWGILQLVFTNDYWGRPMNSPSSHKSWRPLTVLSFRWFQELLGSKTNNALLGHRLCNIVTHAAAAELVAILAIKLFLPIITHHKNTAYYLRQRPQQHQQQNQQYYYYQQRHKRLLLHALCKIAFTLHPTHVEVVANAANRPHLLAVLLALVLCDPDGSLFLYIVCLVAGFLSAETFIFTIPATLVTLSAITYQRRYHHYYKQQQQQTGAPSSSQPKPPTSPIAVPPFYRQVLAVLCQTRWQWVLSITACIAYMALRHALDWLSIPTGLIRPAENPFFDLQGTARILNYAYITAVHVCKSWDVDMVGFSHEYGHACIPPLQSIGDARFLLFVGVVAILLLIGLYFLITTLLQKRQRQGGNVILSTGCVLYLVHLSWLLTLFPITGIVKVGTFVADRIVVPSTISFTLVVAYILTFWLDFSRCYKSHYHLPNRCKWILVVGLVLPLSWHRVHVRTLQWMDSLPLLESSLQTCPNSAKSHLEKSKIYSGLYPHYLDLDQARWHLRRVQEIDADYCDVHQQLAHVAIQQQQQPGGQSVTTILEFEEELLQALLCQFTMGAATGLWKQYWDQTLNNSRHAEAREQAQERYTKYMKTIHEAIAKADREEQERAEAAAKSSAKKKKNKSPFVWSSSREDEL